MRSNTLTPLYQFVEWLGLNGYSFNGIDLDYTNRNISRLYPKGDNCDCFLKYSGNKHWAREDLLEALKMAEDFFITETHIYPSPYQILDERHGLKTRVNTVFNKYGEYKSVRPFHPIGVNLYGVKELSYLNDYAVDKLNGLDLASIFTVSFQLPDTYTANDIRLYFTSSDCEDYSGLESTDYNNHECEIRPLKRITITPSITEGINDVVVEVDAFILRKPELDENESCLENLETIYVDEVSVYLETTNACNNAGSFVFKSHDCLEITPCGETTQPFCADTRYISRDEMWLVPKNYSCSLNDSDEPVYTKYHFTSSYPTDILINYNTGVTLQHNRRINNEYMAAIAKLAIVFMDCLKETCDCEVCFTKKMKHYRAVPTAKVREGEELGEYDDYYQVLVDKIGLRIVDGLPPYRGMLEAFRFMNKIKKQNVEGRFI